MYSEVNQKFNMTDDIVRNDRRQMYVSGSELVSACKQIISYRCWSYFVTVLRYLKRDKVPSHFNSLKLFTAQNSELLKN